MIDNYISDICKLLNIEKPVISYDTSHFLSKTMLAQCKSDGSTIYLRKSDSKNPDYLFSIAHELRHIWQIRNDYNFATIIMSNFFRPKPLYNGLSDNTASLIEKRINDVIQ